MLKQRAKRNWEEAEKEKDANRLAIAPTASCVGFLTQGDREGAKGKRENKQTVSGPALRNAKFIRKTLIAKNWFGSDLIVRLTLHPRKIFIMIQNLLKGRQERKAAGQGQAAAAVCCWRPTSSQGPYCLLEELVICPMQPQNLEPVCVLYRHKPVGNDPTPWAAWDNFFLAVSFQGIFGIPGIGDKVSEKSWGRFFLRTISLKRRDNVWK